MRDLLVLLGSLCFLCFSSSARAQSAEPPRVGDAPAEAAANTPAPANPEPSPTGRVAEPGEPLRAVGEPRASLIVPLVTAFFPGPIAAGGRATFAGEGVALHLEALAGATPPTEEAEAAPMFRGSALAAFAAWGATAEVKDNVPVTATWGRPVLLPEARLLWIEAGAQVTPFAVRAPAHAPFHVASFVAGVRYRALMRAQVQEPQHRFARYTEVALHLLVGSLGAPPLNPTVPETTPPIGVELFLSHQLFGPVTVDVGALVMPAVTGASGGAPVILFRAGLGIPTAF